jgi:hypothetical protein
MSDTNSSAASGNATPTEEQAYASQPASGHTASGSGVKVPKPHGPRRFFSFKYREDVLIDDGIFADLHDFIAQTQITVKDSPREHEWPMVESEANKWIKLVKSHPEPTAYFALDYKTGTLVYYGDFATIEAARADHAEKDPDESKSELLDTTKLREWKTPSSP